MQNHENYKNDSIDKRTALFEKYIMPYQNHVFKLCINYTFSRNDIEDNYNEALINLWKYIDTYDESKPLKPWMNVCTIRLIMDLNYRNSKYKYSDDVNIHGISDEVENQSYRLMDIDNYEDYYSDEILSNLDLVKPIYKDALLLQLSGYSLKEILDFQYDNGMLDNKNIETIKSRIFLAKKIMRKYLNKEGKAK